MSATSAEAGGTSVIVMSSLAFVANATDGTVTTFSLDDDAVLRRLAVSEIGPGCSPWSWMPNDGSSMRR